MVLIDQLGNLSAHVKACMRVFLRDDAEPIFM